MEEKVIKIPDPKKAIYQIGGTTIAIIVVVAFTIYQASRNWHYATFFTVAQAEQHQKTPHQSAIDIGEKLNNKLDGHIDEFRLYTAIQAADAAEDALYYHQSEMNHSGDAPGGRERTRELERRKRHAFEYKECLINNKPNCEQLLKHSRTD